MQIHKYKYTNTQHIQPVGSFQWAGRSLWNINESTYFRSVNCHFFRGEGERGGGHCPIIPQSPTCFSIKTLDKEGGFDSDNPEFTAVNNTNLQMNTYYKC